MTTILEELKARLVAAQKRQQEAQQRFTAAQTELQAATGEFNIWHTAFNLENREESLRVSVEAEDQLPTEAAKAHAPIESETHLDETTEPINKTELVREMLRQHPTGMDTIALWKGFKEQAPGTSRAYFYSVLKRLRDRDFVCVRRGKYVLKAKPQEVAHESAMIQ